jgi:hypothetical protein
MYYQPHARRAAMPEQPQPSDDLEAIRLYRLFERRYLAEVKGRSKALGKAQVTAFSLPEKVVSEMRRQASLEGVAVSRLVFEALVEKILIGRMWEESRGTHNNTGTSDRVAARKKSKVARRAGRKHRKKGA